MAKYRVLMSIATAGMTSEEMDETVHILEYFGWEKLSPYVETW